MRSASPSIRNTSMHLPAERLLCICVEMTSSNLCLSSVALSSDFSLCTRRRTHFTFPDSFSRSLFSETSVRMPARIASDLPEKPSCDLSPSTSRNASQGRDMLIIFVFPPINNRLISALPMLITIIDKVNNISLHYNAMVLELIVAATVLVSLISLIGIVLVFLGKKRIDEILFFLISFSTGTLLGAALFDLLPEASKGIDISAALELAFVGIIVAFVMEKIIHWHHHHAAREREHTHPLGMLTLVGDAFHNFFDGVAIAAAFLVNVPLGLTTTLAIALHEIPQEIGDFGLLLFSGYTKKKALAFNFL